MKLGDAGFELKLGRATFWVGVLMVVWVSSFASIAASLQTNALTLTWVPSSSPGVAGYYLYHGVQSGVYTNRTPVGNTTEATLPGLAAGVAYYFVASAIDSQGVESGFCKEASFTIPEAPSCPTPSVTSFAINGGAVSTTNRAVSLNNNCTSAPTEYMASESSTFNGASWLSYAAAPTFTLSTGPGTKTVFFKVKNACGESSAVADTISYAPPLDLAEALDTLGWIWTTGGNSPLWYPQTALTHDGADAARSGAIADNQTNWLETVVTGPGTLSFWWKVSSEVNHDFVRFLVNGVAQAQRSGKGDWVPASYALGAGAQILRWDFRKDGSGSKWQDAAWLDQVTFTPGTAAGAALTKTGAVELGSGGTRLSLTIKRIDDGRSLLSLRGSARQECLLQASENLVEWTDIESTVIGENGLAEFIDATPDGTTSRFYKVVSTGAPGTTVSQ